MDLVGSIVAGTVMEDKYRKMGVCEKLFCSHKSCPVALIDVVFDCLCAAMCASKTPKPVLSTAPPASEGASAAAAGDAK